MIVVNSKIALGVLDNTQNLEQAIHKIKVAEFPLDKVSVIGKDIERINIIEDAPVSNQIGNQNVNATGAVGDSIAAATWGSVLVGLSSLAIPSLGVILAAGSLGIALITSIAGVAVGAVSNQNLIQAMVNLGIPEEKARVYSNALQQSYYLLMLEGSSDEINQIEPLLKAEKIKSWGVFDAAFVEVSTTS